MNAHSTSSQTTKRPRIQKWLAMGILLLALGAFGTTACLPHPVMFLTDSTFACGSSGGGNESQGSGLLDVDSRSTYNLGVRLLNLLGAVGNPAQFRPETNYIQVREIKVWFEYPPNFSLTGAGPALYPESAPYIQKVFARLNPTLLPDFAGLTAGANAGGAQVTPQVTISNLTLVPPETSAMWRTASELANAATGGTLTVLINFVFTGESGTGSVLTTQKVTFSLLLCKGCLDPKLNAACKGGGGGTGGGSCAGQDTTCLAEEVP